MTNTLLSNNNLFDYNILIGCGFILGCSLLYLIRSNYTDILYKNKEALTNQEIEAIINENAVTIINNENIDAIIDNDSDADVDYQSTFDNESLFDSASSSDFENILEDSDTFMAPFVESMCGSDKFIMPDVDFNVCPIEELKLFELCSLYSREMAEHSISEADLMEMISMFNKEDLATNWINDLILVFINLL
jgi:hypothetical protein